MSLPASSNEGLAKELVEALYRAQLDIDRNGLSHMALEREELRERLAALPPESLLPHYVFALIVEERPLIHILPACQWAEAGDPPERMASIYFDRWFHPVARLLPPGSAPLAAAQAFWSAPSFELPDQIASLFSELLDRGLVWEPRLQAFWDAQRPAQPAGPSLAPVLEARALDLDLPAGSPSKPIRRV